MRRPANAVAVSDDGPVLRPRRRACPLKPTVSGLADLARIAGVSVATVSRSLAGNPVIATATRQRIVELARIHGVRVNQAARNLRLKRTGAIGVILPLGHEAEQHLSDPFFMALLGPLADALADRGHDLLLSRVIPEDDRWLDALVDSGRVDGCVVVGQSNQADAIERVARRYRPLVVWGAALPGMTHLTVGSDNFAGGRLAARHLIERGRTRLAFFGNPEVPEFAARYAGCCAAIAEAGSAPATLLPVHVTSEASYTAIGGFLDNEPPPDGIFAASDVIAMSSLRALSARGVRVPQAVSVVGYDDLEIARHASPPLTTIRQDVVHGAGAMIDLLFRRIEGKETASETMRPELVVRGSS